MTRVDLQRWPLLLLAIAGCTASKPPLSPPDLRLNTQRALGSPLGKTSPNASFDARSAVGVKVTWFSLPTSFDRGLVPLDAVSSLTAAPLGEGAILPTGGISRNARFGSGVAAIQWVGQLPAGSQQVGQQTAFISPGTSVRFSAEDNRNALAWIAIYREMANGVRPVAPTSAPATAPGNAATTTSVINGTFTFSLPGLTSQPDATAGVTETIFLNPLPLSPDTPYVLLLPPRTGTASAVIAAFIETTESTADERELAAWRTQTEQHPPTTRFTPLPGEQLSMQRALQAMASEQDPRSALIYLSSATDARITADVALVADATLLGKMREAVIASKTQSPDTIGWVLEKTTLLTLADAASKAPLPAEMLAVLAAHTGEVGRHPDLLAEIANAVGNPADLTDRLIGENFIALEDNSASARVRAFDWLKAMGKAPADFDPLGSPRSRRAAINRAISTPGGTP